MGWGGMERDGVGRAGMGWGGERCSSVSSMRVSVKAPGWPVSSRCLGSMRVICGRLDD
jgi:hypothetical protein